MLKDPTWCLHQNLLLLLLVDNFPTGQLLGSNLRSEHPSVFPMEAHRLRLEHLYVKILQVAQVLEYYKKVSGLLTVGYARQIVRSALNVLGKPTEHLTTLLNDAEKRNDKVQHVCLDIPSVFFFVSFRCLIGK
jgi:hypothetical protein